MRNASGAPAGPAPASAAARAALATNSTAPSRVPAFRVYRDPELPSLPSAAGGKPRGASADARFAHDPTANDGGEDDTSKQKAAAQKRAGIKGYPKHPLRSSCAALNALGPESSAKKSDLRTSPLPLQLKAAGSLGANFPKTPARDLRKGNARNLFDNKENVDPETGELAPQIDRKDAPNLPDASSKRKPRRVATAERTNTEVRKPRSRSAASRNISLNAVIPGVKATSAGDGSDVTAARVLRTVDSAARPASAGASFRTPRVSQLSAGLATAEAAGGSVDSGGNALPTNCCDLYYIDQNGNRRGAVAKSLFAESPFADITQAYDLTYNSQHPNSITYSPAGCVLKFRQTTCSCDGPACLIRQEEVAFEGGRQEEDRRLNIRVDRRSSTPRMTTSGSS